MSTLKIVILTLLALYLALVTTGAYYGCLFIYFVVMRRGRVPRPAASTPPASRFNAANCSTLSSNAREASPLEDAELCARRPALSWDGAHARPRLLVCAGARRTGTPALCSLLAELLDAAGRRRARRGGGVGGLEQVPDLKPLSLAGEMARARAEGAQAVLLQARGFVCTPTPPDAVFVAERDPRATLRSLAAAIARGELPPSPLSRRAVLPRLAVAKAAVALRDDGAAARSWRRLACACCVGAYERGVGANATRARRESALLLQARRYAGALRLDTSARDARRAAQRVLAARADAAAAAAKAHPTAAAKAGAAAVTTPSDEGQSAPPQLTPAEEETFLLRAGYTPAWRSARGYK